MHNLIASPRPTHHAEPPTVSLSLNYEEVKVTYDDDPHDKWIDILSW